MTRSFVSPQFLGRFGESAALVRQATGGYNDFGEWEPGSETRTEIAVVSAPPSGAAARDIVPEGARLSDWRTFWFEGAAAPVRVGTSPTEGDVIDHGGTRYRIRHVRDWGPQGFVEALGVREEGQG